MLYVLRSLSRDRLSLDYILVFSKKIILENYLKAELFIKRSWPKIWYCMEILIANTDLHIIYMFPCS